MVKKNHSESIGEICYEYEPDVGGDDEYQILDEIEKGQKDSDDYKKGPENPLFGKSQESVDDKKSSIKSKKK